MDRIEECVCCHEIPEVIKNIEVFEVDNPVFEAVGLNHRVLQVVWWHGHRGSRMQKKWTCGL